MAEHDPVRDAARYRVRRDSPTGQEPSEQGEDAAPPGRMENRHLWVDVLVDQAVARGEFDNLALAGKPIPGITAHDPDWWLKALIEREQISGVLPEAIQLRKDDAVLADRLDALRTEQQVRDAVEEFNARVVSARRQLLGGPPVVTPLRDVEHEVHEWSARRLPPPGPPAPAAEPPRRRHGWRRRGRSG
ncbi:J-domain-containing protein [Cellulomonas fengjieae]|uniref:DUF1992 domain-containing protein n=1 Tax=Cellulomonas fengjieae TaxID=2819978 RepID=A0ABS3SI22_9CELL|nr:DUF1992 domain-containing protein [Cellulomonas fengjieae]MBO3084620.1 DUF1992 domain-containing protein [Cellulomonas fengjieae]QVI67054.1 DUF1992 domain-containing protein [Cellulomonas fengjieae]